MKSEEFATRKDFFLSDVQEKAQIGDILKVHDFNYILRMAELVKGLEGTDNQVLKFIDGQDTSISEKSWDAALLACGAVIEAIDKVAQG